MPRTLAREDEKEDGAEISAKTPKLEYPPIEFDKDGKVELPNDGTPLYWLQATGEHYELIAKFRQKIGKDKKSGEVLYHVKQKLVKLLKPTKSISDKVFMQRLVSGGVPIR